MPTKIPLGSDDKGEVFGEPIDYVPEREDWNLYKLADGNTIRLKTIVTSILRTDRRTESGAPVYVLRSESLVEVQASEEPEVQ